MQLKKYKKDFDYSYSFGVFPTLELLKHRPGNTLKVVAHSKGNISSGVDKIKQLCAKHGIPFEVKDKLVERLTHKGNSYVLAVFEKYTSALTQGANHLMLVNPSDMGNLGTIARTALGFKLRDLALLKPAADAFNPQVVRASMGAIFALNIRYFEDLDDYRQHFDHQLYPFMLAAEQRLGELSFQAPFTLIFGPEGAGLPAFYREIGHSVVIPQSPLVESLNLAVAVGIALFEANRAIL